VLLPRIAKTHDVDRYAYAKSEEGDELHYLQVSILEWRSRYAKEKMVVGDSYCPAQPLRCSAPEHWHRPLSWLDSSEGPASPIRLVYLEYILRSAPVDRETVVHIDSLTP
jgi:hypothetical protein